MHVLIQDPGRMITYGTVASILVTHNYDGCSAVENSDGIMFCFLHSATAGQKCLSTKTSVFSLSLSHVKLKGNGKYYNITDFFFSYIVQLQYTCHLFEMLFNPRMKLCCITSSVGGAITWFVDA